MTPTRIGSNYPIQSNRPGPGNSCQKSKRQEYQPREEAQMEDDSTSTMFQRLASTFETLIESPEPDITSVSVVRPESLATGKNRDIPVSVQEMVYGGKAAGVGTSAKSLDRNHEVISSSEDVHGARKDRGTSEGLDTHVFQRTSPTDKSLVEKQKHVFRGPEEEVVPRKGQQPRGRSPSLNKCQTRTSKPQRAIRRASQRQSPSGKSLTNRITGFPRKRRQPLAMCSIWKEL
ncbi:hypothetical protein O181_062517 [Austropuccinia psidii MF-1]|uniref:Uncharacterized protein n=1 Tax=Austropuccinia psidii MF-1 TaxID=1389203 RepID=A0A9Q3EMT2_9BASI|nr:hypothetical protein [Austropuccinia psidii MF-1]